MYYIRLPKQDGATFIELIIIAAITGIICLGIMGLVSLSSKSMWRIGGGLNLTDRSSEAMQFISKDFKNAKASTMGNLGENPGFEVPLDRNESPNKWDDLTTNEVVKSGPADERLRSGFYSVGLPIGTTYYSFVSTITCTREYILSYWIKNEEKGKSECRLVTETEADFIPAVYVSTVTTSVGSNYWIHLTTTTNKPANTKFKFRLTHPYGDQWKPTEFVSRVTAPWPTSWWSYQKLGVYKDKLYVAYFTNNSPPPSSGEKCYNGKDWEEIPDNSIPISQKLHMGLAARAIYNGRIYVYTDGPMGAFVAFGPSEHCVRSFDGNSWTLVDSTQFNQQTWLSTVAPSHVYGYLIFQGVLYFGGRYTKPQVGNGQPAIWRYDGSMQKVYHDASPPEDSLVWALGNYNDSRIFALIVGAMGIDGNGHMLYSDDGVSWQQDPNFYNIAKHPGEATFSAYAMCGYNGKLYVGVSYTFNKSRLVWYDGTWHQGPEFGTQSSLENIEDLFVYDNKLFIGTGFWGFNAVTGHIYSFDGSTYLNEYSLDDTLLPTTSIKSFVEYRGDLYANYRKQGVGGEETGILVRDVLANFDDVSISPAEVIFDSSTIVNGVDNVYRYETSKGNSENDLNRFKLHRLRYEPISDRKNPAWPGKLYREKYENSTWQPAGLQADGAICENVERLKIVNHNQESFDVKLTMNKIIESGSGKEKKQIIHTTITPDVP